LPGFAPALLLPTEQPNYCQHTCLLKWIELETEVDPHLLGDLLSEPLWVFDGNRWFFQLNVIAQ